MILNRRLAFSVASAAILLSGCSTLPRSGPDHDVIAKRASATLKAESKVEMNYALVDISGPVLSYVSDAEPGSLKTLGGGRGPAPEILVGVGDVVQVTIFESSAGGLFIPAESGTRPGNFVSLPNQRVDRNGTLSVPYAGNVPAVGRSLPQIQNDIEKRLQNRAIEPQVLLTLIDQQASEVSVVGDVGTPATLSVNPAGDRILSAISSAGGIRYPGYETFVTLQRGGRKASIAFQELVRNPAENIYVMPGDTIYVYREQRSYVAFGASGLNGKFDFQSEHLSLAEASARAGGLLDDRADPRQVFLYRLESRRTLEKMGVDLTHIPIDLTYVPTVYRANFRQGSSFFLAQSFPMRDKDVLYVSNSDQVELFKFLALVNGVSSTGSGVLQDAASAKTSVEILKN